MNYKNGKWKRKRISILKRDEYLCQENKRYGKSIEATTVHHIYPAEFYPELAFVDWNLISLSGSKHDAMHDRDTHEVTALGKSLQERIKYKFEEWQDKNNPPHL